MSIALTDGQYEVDGLVFGAGTPYVVTSYEDGGLPERVTQDTQREGFDGVIPGRDVFAGLVPSWEILCETNGGGDSFDAAGAFLRAWRGDGVRRVSQGVQVIRMKRPGRETVRVYGRTRRATPVRSRNTGVGLVPIVADAMSVADAYYSDTRASVTVGILPGEGGGFVWPADGVEFPLSTVGATEQQSTIHHEGDVDTWPIITIRAGQNGSLDRPSVALLDNADGSTLWQIALNLTLLAGQSVTLDYRPWVRTVIRENGASLPGARARVSTPADLCVIPPGVWPVSLSGTDATGTASVTVEWEDAYAAN